MEKEREEGRQQIRETVFHNPPAAVGDSGRDITDFNLQTKHIIILNNQR